MVQQIPCQTCGELFTPRASGGKPQVRCSKKCRRKISNSNYIKKNAPIRATTCVECGGPVVQAEKGRPRRFCSDECKARVFNRQARRTWLPVTKPAQQACAHCGKPFTPKQRGALYCPGGPGSGWCAQAAYQARRAAGEPQREVEQVKTCAECGESFTSKSAHAKWCSQICQIRNRGRAASRRRGSARTGDVAYVDREIFERDGWRCHICKRLVRRDVLRTHPEGATIDHLVPLSDGGVDAPANVATAHNRCNLSKGPRGGGEQLALI